MIREENQKYYQDKGSSFFLVEPSFFAVVKVQCFNYKWNEKPVNCEDDDKQNVKTEK